MNKMFAVARWEYMEKIKSKAFLISIIVLPILMIVLGICVVLCWHVERCLSVRCLWRGWGIGFSPSLRGAFFATWQSRGITVITRDEEKSRRKVPH